VGASAAPFLLLRGLVKEKKRGSGERGAGTGEMRGDVWPGAVEIWLIRLPGIDLQNDPSATTSYYIDMRMGDTGAGLKRLNTGIHKYRVKGKSRFKGPFCEPSRYPLCSLKPLLLIPEQIRINSSPGKLGLKINKQAKDQ